MQWLMTNGMNIIISLLAIDRAIERMFPSSKVLKKIDDVLANIAPKQ